MAFQLKWWHGILVLVAILLIVFVAFLDSVFNEACLTPCSPLCDGGRWCNLASRSYETLADAYHTVGAVRISSAFPIEKGAGIVVGQDGFIPEKIGMERNQLCFGADSNTQYFFETQSGALLYKDSQKRNIRIVAVCYAADQLESFVKNSADWKDWKVAQVYCPQDYNATADSIGCFVGIKSI